MRHDTINVSPRYKFKLGQPMTRTMKCLVATLATCFFALAGPQAQGSYLWFINSSQSKVTLSIPDQVVDGNKLGFRNQTGSGSSWTAGNSTNLSGFISTDFSPYSSNPVQFGSGSTIAGLNSGNYRPNPAAFNPFSTSTVNQDGTYTNTSTAPGVLGAKVVAVDVLGAAAAYIAFRDTNFDISSGPLTTTPTGAFTRSFNSAGLQFGISSSGFDLDGLSIILLGQFIPDLHTTVGNFMGTNTNPNGLLALEGLVYKMTIPLSVPLAIDLEGTVLSATLSGQIVAYYMPEPSAFMMGGMGLAALVVYARRRRKSRP